MLNSGDYTSFIELLCAFNFINSIDSDNFKPFASASLWKKIDQFKSEVESFKIYVIGLIGGNPEEILELEENKTLKRIFYKIEDRFYHYNGETYTRDLADYFKPLFFTCGLYCLTLLFAIAYFDGDELKLSSVFSFFCLPLIIIGLTSIAASTRIGISWRDNFGLKFPLMLFAIWIIIYCSCAICLDVKASEKIIRYFLFFPSLSFICLSIRYIIHVAIINEEVKNLRDELESVKRIYREPPGDGGEYDDSYERMIKINSDLKNGEE